MLHPKFLHKTNNVIKANLIVSVFKFKNSMYKINFIFIFIKKVYE